MTKKKIYVPILGICAGELIILSGNIFYGIGIHIVNFLIIFLMLIFSDLSLKERNVLQCMTLLILLRMANLSIPKIFTTELLQYPLIYGIMFLPIYLIIKNQQISSTELGINFEKFYIYLPLSIFIGFLIALVENRIINPIALIDNFRFTNMALIAIIMVGFIGTVEELIFRPILQIRLRKIFGLRYGILLSGILFGIMHSTYGMINEILLGSIFGILMGYIFQKTKSLLFTVSIHGVSNIILFGILPFKMSIISNPIYSIEILSIEEKFITLLLIIILIISLLFNNKFSNNKYISDSVYMMSSPLLLIFITIVISKSIF